MCLRTARGLQRGLGVSVSTQMEGVGQDQWAEPAKARAQGTTNVEVIIRTWERGRCLLQK